MNPCPLLLCLQTTVFTTHFQFGDEGLERKPVSVGKTLGTDTACQPCGAHLVQWTDIRRLIDACEELPLETRRQVIADGDAIVKGITSIGAMTLHHTANSRGRNKSCDSGSFYRSFDVIRLQSDTNTRILRSDITAMKGMGGG